MNNIFLLWFGDNEPYYANWTVNNYKIINNNWNVKYIKYNKDQILNYRDQNDPILVKTIEECFHKYGTNFSYNTISDLYRWKIIYHKYDVYVDLDTFPIQNMDNFILPHETEINHKFNLKSVSYCREQKRRDQWLLCRTNRTYCSILNVDKNINLNDDIIYHKFTFMNENRKKEFENRCELFAQCKIDIKDNFCCRKFTPCEHYMIRHRNKSSTNYIEQFQIFNKVLI